MSSLQPFLKLNKQKDSYELELINVNNLIQYKAVEVTFFLYPFNKTLTADSFKVSPYEEYVNDISLGRRSTYEKIDEFSPTVFGFALGVIISLFFLVLKPDDFFSIQSIVSIFGAYAIGKEIWQDLNNFLVNLTKNWNIKWKDGEYFYTKQDFGTIQKFWRIGRVNRYHTNMVLPSKLDFITQSNSKTVELLYSNEDLKLNQSNTLRIANIDFLAKDFKDLNLNFLFTTKLTFVKKGFLFNFSTEYFQAINNGELGSIGEQDDWQKNVLLKKEVLNIGQIKIYLKKCLIKNEKIVNLSLTKGYGS